MAPLPARGRAGLLVEPGADGQLLDRVTIARQLGVIYMFGSLLAFVYLLLPQAGDAWTAGIAVPAGTCLALGIWMLIGLADRWPLAMFAGVMAVATVAITAAQLASGQIDGGFVFYYLWTPPWAFLLFSQRTAVGLALFNVSALAGSLLVQVAVIGVEPAPGAAGLALIGAGSLVATGLFASNLARAMRSRSAEQEAVAALSAAVAAGEPSERIFAAAAAHARRMVRCEAAFVMRYTAPGEATVVGLDAPARTPHALGDTIELRRGAVAQALGRRRPARIETTDLDLVPPVEGLEDGATFAACAAPILVDGVPWGALSVYALRGGAFDADTERRMERFAACIALGIASAEARRELQQRATTDALTGLANRRGFQEQLAAAAALARRDGEPLSLAVLDLDGFKDVNDTYGHEVGDDVLVEVARRLRAVTREHEALARLGGDEFALILPGLAAEAALRVGERVREAITAEPLRHADGLTTSVGVCDLALAGSTSSLVRYADAALLHAKTHGRDVAIAFEPSHVGEPAERRRVAHRGRQQALAGLHALARAMDARDASTARHSEGVRRFAELLAGRLGWAGAELAALREAALIHDIGKLGVDDAILRKPGRLTDEEMEQMRTHAALGARIAEDVLDAEQVAWIRHHHERIDGRGYPDGIAGDEIPLGARILAVADTYEAITSGRSYAPARSAQEALAICRAAAADGQLDPEIVGVLVGLARDGLLLPLDEDAALAS